MYEIRYSPALDGLRAICIIFTIFNHIDGTPGFINGSVGVDVFFPLSGFLITGILMRNDWSDLRGYYIRRFFRIAPVYYLSFAITISLAVAAHHLHIGISRIDQAREILIPSMLFSRELASSATLFGQAWTVGIEEKFYLVWPVVFLLPGSRRKVVLALCLILVGLAVLQYDKALRGYGGIALGCIASVAYFKRGFQIHVNLALGLLALAYAFCLYSDLRFANITISMASALLIPALYARSSLVSRALSNKTIVQLGRMTFSIYMLHVIVVFFMKTVLLRFGIHHWLIVFAIGYSAVVACAWAVYRYFEGPLIAYGKRLSAQ